MKSLMLALALGVSVATATSAAEPTTRRVLILCESEDPECVLALAAAMKAVMADQYWEGVRQICPERHAPYAITVKEAAARFWTANTLDTSRWPYPARIGMLHALDNLCQWSIDHSSREGSWWSCDSDDLNGDEVAVVGERLEPPE